MHVFVTGATGWVGSAVVQDLIGAGHQVTGLARNDEKAARLAASGATVLRATLDDLDALNNAASTADAVIHTAFNHDFSKFPESAAQDQRVIEALGSALEGSKHPLLVTSGLSGLPAGATEADLPDPASPRRSEVAARALKERGVRVATVRLAPSVHGIGDHGFIPIVIRLAREKGVSAYIGDGQNKWSGVYRLDAAKVYRLALEQGVTEAVYHAVADEAVPFRDIASIIGRWLGLPVEPREREHFGWFANMAGGNMAASSARTRALLGWNPTGPSLLADLEQPAYYA
ncbi:SDR family oxidoreductase [Komagataeibacter intermedius]|uniref:3-beta hydroxysteroid dehydrogenase n=2 Tax=Komagataeibacter intermedius TaxID=66229 RepID=A0A0N1FB80_9PROT|nr:SDR family oxidoreductase [Komagataeibacter intermedius]KPH86657.1 3-beta hydroxysteroid dehydrogenase [Komagataeibacter intermedius AF2]MCF3637070.1 SDR family oxidoreductase [Komagataeibacter intermedius]GAN88514.1 NAD dependent epimerase/dehydratase [Komagataeibacter intermedius TF2]GBQ65102.1 nucleoside-diphosphate-sugar epimerase [Komagataeibacter intermedius NRIC 0521]